MEKKNPQLNTSSSTGGGFTMPMNPMGGSVRPSLESTNRAIQEAKERAMARLSNFPQFVRYNKKIIIIMNFKLLIYINIII